MTASLDQPATLVEFCSDEWVELARQYLDEHVPALGPDATGVEFSICDVFTSPPAHLDDGSGKVTWWFSISVPKVEVGRGDRTDLKFRHQVDYSLSLPYAHDLVEPGDLQLRKENEELRAEVERLGGHVDNIVVPPQLLPVVVGMHNYLAVRTR